MKKKIRPFFNIHKAAYKYDRASVGANIAYEKFCTYALWEDEQPTREGLEIYFNINILFWSVAIGARIYG